MFRPFCLLALCFLALVCPRAEAVITRLTPLKSIIDDSDVVAVATVASIDRDRPSLSLNLETSLKGTAAAEPMAILLKGASGSDAKQVLDRVNVGTRIIVFITELPDRHMALLYTEGSWFQVIGQSVGGGEGKPRWGFTSAEPYLRRTFKGTTDELKQLVAAYVKDDKTPLPAPTADEPPGLGPVLPAGQAAPAATDTKPAPAVPQSKDAATAAPATPPAATDAPTGESIQPWLIVLLVGVAIALVWALRKKGG